MRAFLCARRIDLSGKVVLITGGSRGLGYLLAQEFARQGCRLAICARDEAELERAHYKLSQGGAEVVITRCDVAEQKQVEQWVKQSLQHFGQIDILVNNAGVIQVAATKSGAAEVTLTLSANLLARFHGLFPGLTANILGLVNGLSLPKAVGFDRLNQLHRDLLGR